MGMFKISLILILFLQTQFAYSQNFICNSNDLKALHGFMSSLESLIPDWTDANSDCCSWTGITCTANRVHQLQLVNQRLTGKLPESFSGLDRLTTLNLSRNSLSGPIPVSLLHLPHLRILDLSVNIFSGYVPMSINLPALKVFNVSYNSFHGPIPGGICRNSTGIRVLQLGVNYFNGSVSLELRNCGSLKELSLNSNHVSGNIPEFLFQLPNLVQLSLQDNVFTGQLSSIRGIGNQSKLERLDVSTNVISGNLPDFFDSLPKLYYFAAKSNLFSGGIPPSLSNSGTISSLLLRNNSLSGPIDLNCSAMINLVSLDLSINLFSGYIPANLASCPKLKAISLARTMLVGRIPESFKSFNSLSFFSATNCSLTNLSASLETLQFCPNLTTLILTQNFLHEELPSHDRLQFKSLQVLIIPHCGLKGEVPRWLKASTGLQFLDLGYNQLTGSIPSFFDTIRSLFYVSLSNNSLTGEIPISLTRLPNFVFQDVTPRADPAPDFPIFKMQNLTERSLQYNHPFQFPPTLDLSGNLLTGPIWPEFGDLKKLHVLDLKCNNLSGNIPNSLSNMTNIETLNLSNNSLSGTIPPSLVRLSFLSKFSVAFNKLTGIIPSGGQFSTFQESSFEGNPGLCGQFVYSCPVDLATEPERKNKKGSVIGAPVWAGFGLGFFVAVMSFIVVPAVQGTLLVRDRGFLRNRLRIRRLAAISFILDK